MVALRPVSLARIAQHIWHSLNDKQPEWASAMFTVGLGYSLLAPSERVAYSPSFAVVVAMFGATTLGGLILAGGLCRLGLLAINGAWHSSPIPRALAAGCTSLLWGVLFLSFYLSMGFSAPGTWFYLVLTVGDFLSVGRAMRDAAASVYLKNGKMIRRVDGTLEVSSSR